MAEGLQAGRLDVPVIADLAGFAAKLRTEVESAAEGLAAKIKVEIDGKGLRRRLKDVVEEASKGVTATVKVKVDEERVRAEIDGLRRRLDDADLRVPVRPDGDGDNDGSSHGGLLDGLRDLINGAQGEADRTPVNVPVRMSLPGGGRGSLRMLGIGSIISLLQPAVALIGQYGAGLTALVSAAAPAVGVLGAIPGLIAAAGSAAIGTKIAFSGFGEALKQSSAAQQQLAQDGKVTKATQEKLQQALDKLSPSAQKAVSSVTQLSGAWSKVKVSISERFFSKVADQIKPLADKVLPLLDDALGDSAEQMGKLAQRGVKAMQTGAFSKDFAKVAGTNSRVVGNLTDGLANMGHATMDFLVASGPFVERVGQAGEKFTQWVRASVQAGRQTGSLAKFLDHAGDKAAQLGRTTGSLIQGLGGVGKAAMETGNALLDGLEGSMEHFEQWANSGSGQKAMRQFFSDAAPAFHEVNRLFGDLMRGMGRAMKDGGITDLVRQIRTQLMPALGTFFTALGQSVGPAVVSVISNLATVIGNLSQAGSGLGVLLVAFNGLLHAINALTSAFPFLNTAVAVFLGVMVSLKVVTAVSGMLRSFGTSVASAGTSVRGLGTTLQGTATAAGGSLSLWGRMTGVYSRVSQQGNRLTGTLRGIGAANAVASRAMGGMVSALGGPLGITIAAVTIGLGLLASKQETAARATQAHQERVKALTDALAESNGAIDANVRAKAVELLQDTKLADGKTRLVDVMRDADVSLKDLTNAYLEQGGSVTDLQKKLMGLADEHKEYVEHGRDMYVLDYSEQGKRYKAAADALKGVNGELKDSKRDASEAAVAMSDGASTGKTAYDRLSDAVTAYSDKTKTADARTTALKDALDALNGNVMSIHDAQARLNEVMLQAKDSMGNARKESDGWGKSLIDVNGLVDTSTKNGQDLNTQLGQLRDGLVAYTTAAQEAAEQGEISNGEAATKTRDALNGARTSALAMAESFGLSKTQMAGLLDQMGLVPSEISTVLMLSGSTDVNTQLVALSGKLGKLKEGETIPVKALTSSAGAALADLGFSVRKLPDGRVFVTANTKLASANITDFAGKVKTAPKNKKVTVDAVVKQATGDLEGVKKKVSGLKGKTVTVKAPTTAAQAALKDLGFKIKNVDKGGKTVKITVPYDKPKSNVASIQSAINALHGKSLTVYVDWVARGKGAALSKHADGGIVRYAEGGVNALGRRIKTFANGAENHIAQVARGGEWRVWAEDETQGEAYLPLAKAKRKRSEEILDWVARYFGGMVVYPNRALQQYAGGGVRTSTSAATSRASTAQQATSALVGGDLNLTMTSEPTTPGQALNDALFELRRMRRGGLYV
ncbi:hypothetical protein [Streptomyces sp. BH055]|uniref:hypothetical protein n=1 Tax=unclassified Streptomyces TaxID=2593676 RepID=UPI003BB52E19